MYKQNTANYPRLKTDVYFTDYNNTYSYSGFMDNAIRYIENKQLLDTVLWKRFVEQYRMEDADYDEGWRGEYWGKMMRGASLTYAYTKNPELYDVLTATVEDMMSCQEEDGRLSSYARNHEFHQWDMWGRKYVLLGMQYFLEICEDEAFAEKVVKSMCAQTDYIMEHVGDGEGKTRITQTSDYWKGLNSSSILEPVVRLYNITNDKRYLDFATHIVNCGGSEFFDIFKVAYEDKFYPYQYAFTKAYEMTSCFEGLLEYYRVTGDEKCRDAVIRYADKVLETEFTIIGSCGCSHENFDHSVVRQANTTNGPSQETCVTVTMMKFMYQLTLFTGDSKYADIFERALYNAYLGSFNTEDAIEANARERFPNCIEEPLPFGSYSPLTAGLRGQLLGGPKLMADNHYYGCCACMGAAGNGLVPKMALMTSKDGFAMNLYINGVTETTTPDGNAVKFITETAYPVWGNIKVTLKLAKSESFTLKLRNPEWSKTTKVSVNGKGIAVNDGYIAIDRVWNDGDVVDLELDMRTRAEYPIPYGEQITMSKALLTNSFYVIPVYDVEDPMAKHHIALLRGPVVLAQDNRLGYSVDDPVTVKVTEGYVDTEVVENKTTSFDTIMEVKVPLEDGTKMTLIDYSSAGKTWTEESKMAAWILTK